MLIGNNIDSSGQMVLIKSEILFTPGLVSFTFSRHLLDWYTFHSYKINIMMMSLLTLSQSVIQIFILTARS